MPTIKAFDRYNEQYVEHKTQNHNDTGVQFEFHPSVQISDSTLWDLRGPLIYITDDNIIYAILTSGPFDARPRYIRFTQSSDTGRTWLKPNIVIHVNSDIITMHPSMDVGRDGSINVIWQENPISPYHGEIKFSRSTNGGHNWSDPIRVDDGNPTTCLRNSPNIVSIGDTFVACWGEGPANRELYPIVRISTDAGSTWGIEHQIDCVPLSNSIIRPYIRYDSIINRLYIVWDGNDSLIYVARSTDLGVTWQASIASIDNIGEAKYASMELGVTGELYVVWTETRWPDYGGDIFLSKSTDSGVSWSNSVLVNDHSNDLNQYEPHISVDTKGFLHVAWLECVPFLYMTGIYYTLSTDQGITWLTPNMPVADFPYNVSPSVPYSLSIASDTTGFAYIGWTYNFYHKLNFFSTNRPYFRNDVGIASIDIQPGLPQNITLYPQATVRNFGLNTNTFNVTCTIDPGGYTSTTTVHDLLPGSRIQVTFPDLFTFESGLYTVTVYTQLASDENTVNDTLDKQVEALNWLYYDDGLAVNAYAYNDQGNGWGVQIPVFFDWWVDSIAIHIWPKDWPIPGSDTATFRIYDGSNQPTNLRQELTNVIVTRGSWNKFALDTTINYFNTGDNFYVFYIQVGEYPYCPGLSIDTVVSQHNYMWTLINGNFGVEDFGGDWLIRAHVITETGICEWISIKPKEFMFKAPMITKGKTRIEFILPEMTKVNLLLYDGIGRLREEFASKQFSAGSHSINVNLDFPVGVYFYNLRTESGINYTMKFLLVR
ncbi:MAG: sialidase family protein [bacterium]